MVPDRDTVAHYRRFYPVSCLRSVCGCRKSHVPEKMAESTRHRIIRDHDRRNRAEHVAGLYAVLLGQCGRCAGKILFAVFTNAVVYNQEQTDKIS